MPLISILVALIIVGVLLWAVQQIPMDATIKRIITVLAVVICVLYLLQALGILAYGIRLR